MGLNLRTWIMVTLLAATGIYVLKATSGFVPFAPYRTFTQAV